MNKLMIDEIPENAVVLDGFDDCIIGVAEIFGDEGRITYSVKKIIQKLMQDMSQDDAYEYYYYNMVGGYFAEQNPVFLRDD